ncbi:MAG: hypothetical protein H7175_12335 [Burkholderiales bacterium]|nr:hypothetical protein [Anaerolineae bacterium]
MTHPFHPLFGREFELVVYRHNWGEDRVYFHDTEGTLCSLPASWTNAIDPDPLVVIAAGRSHFRCQDLLQVAEMLAELRRSEDDAM